MKLDILQNIEGKISIYIEEIDNYIKISLFDNGGGIEESIIKNVFEPYFTTKIINLGTGLGLYISKIIIEDQLNGQIYLENIEDGLKSTILIPILKDDQI